MKGCWPMADLSINFAGIRSPNPFWLASAPPSNTGMQVHRAFEAGLGGAVSKKVCAPGLYRSKPVRAWDFFRHEKASITQSALDSDSPIRCTPFRRYYPEAVPRAL